MTPEGSGLDATYSAEGSSLIVLSLLWLRRFVGRPRSMIEVSGSSVLCVLRAGNRSDVSLAEPVAAEALSLRW